MCFMRSLALPLMMMLAVWGTGLNGSGDEKKPKISVKANPAMAISPARVVVSADVNGGPDDNQELYCAGVEWDWGDDTHSNTSEDCEPYEAGKSQIKRRFTADHVYRLAGEYRIQFRLKKKEKAVMAGSTSVRIRPGLGDPGGLH